MKKAKIIEVINAIINNSSSLNPDAISIDEIMCLNKKIITNYKRQLISYTHALSRGTFDILIGGFNFKDKQLTIIFRANETSLESMDSGTYNKLFDKEGPKELVLKKSKDDELFIVSDDYIEYPRFFLDSNYKILEEIYNYYLSMEDFLTKPVIVKPINSTLPIEITPHFVTIGSIDTCGFKIKNFIQKNKTLIDCENGDLNDLKSIDINKLTKNIFIEKKDYPFYTLELSEETKQEKKPANQTSKR